MPRVPERALAPNRPCGRHSSTIEKIAKLMTVMRPGSSSSAASVSASPRMRPATRPPSTWPMPPITTTISAFMVKAAPMVGLMPTKEDSRMPAMAASAPPAAKASAL